MAPADTPPPAPTTEPVVTLESVSLRFGSVTAVDSVTATVNEGQTTALIGPNGSGKTSVLRLIAGLEKPTNGQIDMADSINVAYLTQHASTPSWLPMSVGDVLAMGRYRHLGLLGRASRQDRAIVEAAAERMGVASLADKTYGDLSGGQRQRVRLAQALAQEPALLLLDEPITGLDLTSQQLIVELLDSSPSEGLTTIITTHNLDEARHCAQVLVMRSHLVAAGTPEETLTAENLRLAFGDRLLGDHDDHNHDTKLLMFDNHGHNH